MRRLLTGYAGAFNRRHRRHGYLFQNRYKSIVVEEEPYLLELVRYLHVNPLRATVVSDLRALARDPWTGHSALVGTVARPWHATQTILAPFWSHGRSVGRGVGTIAVIANVIVTKDASPPAPTLCKPPT